MSLESILSDPTVAAAVEKAKMQVAQSLGISPEDVYHRLVTTDDFDSIPGNATPGPAAYPITFAAGNNDYIMKSVGDRFIKIVVVGYYTHTTTGAVNFQNLLTNGNRILEIPGSALFDSTSGIMVLPSGPVTIHEKCAFTYRTNLTAVMAGVTGNDFPVIIGFPVCG